MFISCYPTLEDKFYTLTPRRYYLYLNAFYKSHDRSYETDMTVGYVSSSLVMASKRPSLDEILGREKVLEFEDVAEEEINDHLIAAFMQHAATV